MTDEELKMHNDLMRDEYERGLHNGRAAERERCAVIFDGYQPVHYLLTSTVAAKIRGA